MNTVTIFVNKKTGDSNDLSFPVRGAEYASYIFSGAPFEITIDVERFDFAGAIHRQTPNTQFGDFATVDAKTGFLDLDVDLKHEISNLPAGRRVVRIWVEKFVLKLEIQDQ